MSHCPECNSKCKNGTCGCEDKGLTTNTPCAQDTPECPNPNPCSETFSDDCVYHTADTILDIDIKQGDNLTRILQKLVLTLTNPACIAPASACKSAINVHSTKITSTSVKLAWDNNPTAVNGYITEYKLSTSSTWTMNIPVAQSAYPIDTIGGLLADTEYDIRISSLCSAGTCYSVTIRVKTKNV